MYKMEYSVKIFTGKSSQNAMMITRPFLLVGTQARGENTCRSEYANHARHDTNERSRSPSNSTTRKLLGDSQKCLEGEASVGEGKKGAQ